MTEKKPKPKLFQYAVLFHPTEKDQETKLIVDLTTILAKDEGVAALKAARAIPEEYANDLDRVEVAVRPF